MNQPFTGTTAPGWMLGGSSVLTSGNGDPAGNGWLRITNKTTYQAGYAYYDTPIPTGEGLIITFDYAAWGGSGADGLTFFLFDGATTMFNIGASGGSLGYAQKTGVKGISNGYLGLGLDEFGNYSNPNEGRIGGPGYVPQAVAIRGPGNNISGYNFLTGTTSLNKAPYNLPRLDCPASFGTCGTGATRPASSAYYRKVQITLSPIGSAFEVTVSMKFSETGSWTRLLGSYTMPTSAPGTLKMGFAGSTGGSTNYHEIRNLSVTKLVPDLTVSKAVDNYTTGGGSVSPGEELLYTMVFSNHTDTTISNVHFTDSIPANTTFVANSASVPTGSTIITTNPIDVTGITIPSNGQAMVTFRVRANDPLPISVTQISNQGAFSYNSGTITSQTDGDAVTTGNQATTIAVTLGPNFDTSTKMVSYEDLDHNNAVSVGDRLTYHVTLPNTGNQNAATISFQDTLPANVTYETASAAVSAGTVTYNSTLKKLTWTVSVATIAQETLDFKVTVNSGVKIRDLISNQGSITYNNTTILTDADLEIPGKQPTQLLVGGMATLTAVKTASVLNPPLIPGGQVEYSIILTNTGSYAISGATFVDAIPANTTYVAASVTSTSGTASYISPAIRVSDINLAGNESATITFHVSVNDPLPAGVTQISNQGLANWDSNNSGANNTSLQTDGDPASSGQQPTVIDMQINDLAVTKTIDDDNPAENGSIHYSVMVTNNGPSTANNIVINDNLPSGLSLVSSNATQGDYANPIWTVGTLANKASATLDIIARVDPGKGGATIINTASASSAYYDNTAGNNTANASLTVKITTLTGLVTDKDSGAVLANATVQVTDSASNICTTTTDGNGEYTFTSGMAGCLLTSGVVVVDANAEAYLQKSMNKTITSGVHNIQDIELVRPSLIGVVTDLGTGVPIVGATVTLTQGLTTCITTSVAGGSYSFISGIVSPACDFTTGSVSVTAAQTGYQSNTQTPTILASGATTMDLPLGNVDLLITKTDLQKIVQPGQNLTYVITVTNTGSITAPGIVIEDTPGSGLIYVSDTTSSAGLTRTSPDPAAGVYQWTLPTLAVGDSITFDLLMQVSDSLPNGTSTLVNYVKTSTTGVEKNRTNNDVTDLDTVNAQPDLAIRKIFTSPPPASLNSTIIYKLTGGNLGHATATGITILDTQDAATTYTPGSAVLKINGSSQLFSGESYESGTHTLTLGLPDLAPGDNYEITYADEVVTLVGNPQSLINKAEIHCTEADPNSGNDTSSTGVPTINSTDIGILKSAVVNSNFPKPGDLITYTLNYRNNGSYAAESVNITDSIPANSSLVSGSITGGGSVAGGIITWNLGTINSQASGSVGFTVAIDESLPSGANTITNTALINTTSDDQVLTDNSSTVSTSLNAQPDLVITKSDSQTQVLPGDSLAYTITYQNTGNQGAEGVTIVDTLLNGVLIDESQLVGATYNGSTPASTYNPGARTLIWNIGTLGVGILHTISLDLIVDPNNSINSVAANRITISDNLANGEDPNPADNTATDSNLVVAPYITLEKGASGPVYFGQDVEYTIQWKNSGSVSAEGVTIEDTLPGNTTLVIGSITGGGTYNAINRKITWNLGTRAVGAFGSVNYKVTIGVGAGGSISPAASLSSESESGNVTVTSSVTPLSLPWCENTNCESFKGIYQGTNGAPTLGWNDNPRMTVFNTTGWTLPVAASTAEADYWTNANNLSAEWVSMHLDPETTGNFSFFRQAFCLPLNASGLSSSLQLAGDDVSDIYLNGVYVGRHISAGSAGTYNADSGIQSGINILSVQLLNNRHNGHPPFNGGDYSGLLFNLGAAFTDLHPFASGPNTVPAGATVTFNIDERALGGKKPYEYMIDYGDGTAVDYQAGTSFTHTYATPGSYNAYLTARAAYGCTGTDLVAVTVLPAPSSVLSNLASVSYLDSHGQPYSGQSGIGNELHLAADLSIEKTILAGGETPGQNVTYQVTATNFGPNTATGALVTDNIPETIRNVTWTCAATGGGTCAHSTGSGNVSSERVNLPLNATATFIVQGLIDPSAAAGSLTNKAMIASPSDITDLIQTNNDSEVTSTLSPDIDLVVTKSSSPKPGLAPGFHVSYIIGVNNNGSSNAVGARVTDTLPTELADGTWTCTASDGSSCTQSGSGNIDDTVTILGGGTLTYNVRALVDPMTAAGTIISNSATITLGMDSVSETDQNTTAAATILTATNDALNNLGISSRTEPFIDTDGSGGITPGDTLRYKVVINNGSGTAYQITFRTNPDPNTTLKAGSVSCDVPCTVNQGNTSGDTSVNAEIVSIPPNGSVIITYDAVVNTDLPFLLTTLSNQGFIASINSPASATDDPATLENGDETTVMLTLGIISGFTWRDDDGDGVVDSGEPRMPDVPATLYFAGLDGILNNSDDQVKVGALNVNGTFSFPNLSAGKYLVGFAAPYSYKFSPPGIDNDVIANGLTDIILLNSTAELRTGIGSGLEPDSTVFQMNFGHLPAAYSGMNIRIQGGAWSLTGPIYLGHSITTALEGINTVNYTVKKSDDGITWTNDWSSNTGYATINAVCPEPGGKRDLYAWFDWNHDNDFEDTDETSHWMVDCSPDGVSSNIFFTFPGSISTAGKLNNGTYYTRFRIYDEEPADPKPSGVALSASRAYMVGEIEDPFITIGGSQSPQNESKNMPGNLPTTGFPYGKITQLPIQPAEKLYSDTDLVLDIPSLGINATIVGVPQTEEGWDVSWLGKNAGYLYGSAYPTWAGNTVLTGHVWNADNTPGVFINIKNLKYGDHFFIRYLGQVYTYEVRENILVYSSSVTPVFKSEKYDWVTLLTCENFNAVNNGYQNRRIIRAVLVKVE